MSERPGPGGSFGSSGFLDVDGAAYRIFRLDTIDGAARLPFSLKILLENLLRNEDGRMITAGHIQALAGWDPAAEPSEEIGFTPARVLMQDFTGVPCIVNLAAMREAMTALGGDPARISPLRPAELIIDHSVIADHFGEPGSLERNIELEYQRNRERYQFLRCARLALLIGAADDGRSMEFGTNTVPIIEEYSWGLELRHHYGSHQEKYFFVDVARELQDWGTPEVEYVAGTSFQGTALKIGWVW